MEQVDARLMAMWQRARQDLVAPQTVLSTISAVIVALHSLSPQDQVDEQTGAITRAAGSQAQRPPE